jgi:predicted histone-like DNA-binding protein
MQSTLVLPIPPRECRKTNEEIDMLFWKKTLKKVSGGTQLWYPRLVLVGKAADTQELGKRLARESTVSPADVHAVIRALPQVMADIMAEGRAVHLDGLGSFYYTIQSSGNGVQNESEVSSKQINGVRVQFIPTRERQGTQITRALVGNLSFTEWMGKDADTGDTGGGSNSGGGNSGDGGGATDE